MSMECPKCRKQIPTDSRFCVYCRAALGGSTRLQAPTQLAPTIRRDAPGELPADNQTLLQQLTRAIGGDPTQIRHGISPGLGASCPSQPEDTCLVFDVSLSMKEEYDRHTNKLQAAKTSGITMVDEKRRIDSADRVAVVAFSLDAWPALPLTGLRDGRSRIVESINGMDVHGGTDIDAGLRAAEESLDWSRHDAVRRVVLLTDGHGGDPLATAERLSSRGVVIDVIGVGPDPSEVNDELLRKVASVIQGRSRYRFISNASALVQHYTMLAGKTAIR